jgi:hypothetical protein
MISLLQAAFGYTLLNQTTGDVVRNLDARTAGMGGASVAGGTTVLDAVSNPASIAFLPGTLNVEATALVMHHTDDRALPMYNFFDGYVGDATYATNTNFFDDYALALRYGYNLQGWKLAVALSHRPVVSFAGEYQEQVRNDANSNYEEYPPIIAKNFITNTGRLSAAGMQLAFGWQDAVSVGLGVDYIYGDATNTARIIWTDAAYDLAPGSANLQNYAHKIEREFDAAYGIHAGAQWRINERITVGASYALKTEFDATVGGYINDIQLDTLATASPLISDLSDYVIPSEIRMGVRYEPRNIMRTYFNADMRYIAWSEVSELYDDAVSYNFGVEHQFRNKLPLRLGFMYQTAYITDEDDGVRYAQEITTPGFSVGSGFVLLDAITVDIAAQLNYRTYKALDLFMDSYYNQPGLWNEIEPEDRGWDKPDTVNETTVGLTTSISYKW